MRTPRLKYFLTADLSQSFLLVELLSVADSTSIFSHCVPMFLGVSDMGVSDMVFPLVGFSSLLIVVTCSADRFEAFPSLLIFSLSLDLSLLIKNRHASCSGTMKPDRLGWLFWIQHQACSQGTLGSHIKHCVGC